MLESMRYFSSLLALFVMLPMLVLAGPAEEAELADIDQRQANLNLKKDWAKYRLEKKQHECYDKFFTTRCLDQARLEHRQEIKEIRAQEIPMHERQRVLKAILKDEKDAERLKQRNDPLKEEKRQSPDDEGNMALWKCLQDHIADTEPKYDTEMWTKL